MTRSPLNKASGELGAPDVEERGQMKTVSLVIVVAAVVGLSGCATAIRGTTQRIAVATEPPGAQCTLTNARGEAPVVVAPTPGIAEVRRDRSDLEIRCEMPERLEMSERFAPEWTILGRASDSDVQRKRLAGSAAALGVATTGLVATAAVGAGMAAVVLFVPLALAVIVGAPIGFAIDIGTGAAYVYPSAIAILMPPAAFTDEPARSEYFNGLESKLRDAHASRRKENEVSCTPFSCARLLVEDDAFLAERLAWIESTRQRTRTVVQGPR